MLPTHACRSVCPCMSFEVQIPVASESRSPSRSHTHTSLTMTYSYSHSHSHYSNQSTIPAVDAAMLILGLRHEQSIVIKPKSLPAKTTGLVGPRRRAGRFGRREAIRARILGGSALSLRCPPTVDKGEREERWNDARNRAVTHALRYTVRLVRYLRKLSNFLRQPS